MSKIFSKGQSSTEFLIVLAIIIAIAVVIIGITGSPVAPVGKIDEQQLHAYWQNQYPFSVNDYRSNGTQISLVLQNKNDDNLTITGIFINEILRYPNSTHFGINEQKTVSFGSGQNCIGIFSYNLSITYNDNRFANLSQRGEKNIVGVCG